MDSGFNMEESPVMIFSGKRAEEGGFPRQAATREELDWFIAATFGEEDAVNE